MSLPSGNVVPWSHTPGHYGSGTFTSCPWLQADGGSQLGGRHAQPPEQGNRPDRTAFLGVRSDRKESFLTCLNIGRELAKLNVSVVSKGLFQKLTPAHFFLIIHRPSKDNVRVEGQEVAGERSLLKHPPWICVQRQL